MFCECSKCKHKYTIHFLKRIIMLQSSTVNCKECGTLIRFLKWSTAYFCIVVFSVPFFNAFVLNMNFYIIKSHLINLILTLAIEIILAEILDYIFIPLKISSDS